TAILALSVGSSTQTITNQFFGMQMEKAIMLGEPWPVDHFSGTRLWDSGVAWPLLNPAPGVYNWSLLDAWINASQKHGVDLIYTFGRVPQWASSDPNDNPGFPACANNPGACYPPKDLNLDGSGTDQIFKNFVSAIVKHANGRIKYWEIWDEASNPMRWTN